MNFYDKVLSTFGHEALIVPLIKRGFHPALVGDLRYHECVLTHATLLNKLEAAVGAMYEMAERYSLYKEHHAWKHAKDACLTWQKAVQRAYDMTSELEYLETDPTQEDIERIRSILVHMRHLGSLTKSILAPRSS